MNRHSKRKLTILIFLLPMTLIYILFEIIPIIGSFWFSFFKWNGIQGSPLVPVGLENYVTVITSNEFQNSLVNVLWYVVLSILLQVLIGFMMAYLIFEAKRFIRYFKAAYFMPLILPIAATSILWRFILFPNDSGILNQILIGIGLPQLSSAWLVDQGTALNSLIVITAWSSFGYYMIIGLAALSAIPDDVLEAAVIDGANKFQRVMLIMVPMIRGAIALSVIMVITGILKLFDVVFVMTNGGPYGLTEVPATLMYNESFKYNNFGSGSAIAVVIFLMSLVMTMLTRNILEEKS